MANSMTVNLPDDVLNEINRVAESEGLTPDEIVCQSLRDFLFVRKFRSLRKQMAPKAQEQGIQTDEDVFDRVS